MSGHSLSGRYITEPPTKGKVTLHLSIGDVDVELFAKETPLACRNFVQLCMEGYYNGTSFHRVIKGFMAQGGDPTGTGIGGESIYDGFFKDELHSRLKFKRRGLLAMANDGVKHHNLSQFFITLGNCDWLDKKHTIFGKVVGDTVYNILKFDEIEVDGDDRPTDTFVKIKGVTILNNPFDDIVPRRKTKMEEPKVKKKKRKKAKKNTKLLSFGDEADEMEEEFTKPRKKIASVMAAHPEEFEDSGKNDKKIKSKKKKQFTKPEDSSWSEAKNAEDFEKKMRNKILKAKGLLPKNKSDGEGDGTKKLDMMKLRTAELKRELMKSTRERERVQKRKRESEDSDNEMTELDKMREQYMTKRLPTKERKKQTKDLFQKFDKQVRKDRKEAEGKIERKFWEGITIPDTKNNVEDETVADESGEESDSYDPDWMKVQIKFQNRPQAYKNIKNFALDDYEVIDSRNPEHIKKQKEQKKKALNNRKNNNYRNRDEGRDRNRNRDRRHSTRNRSHSRDRNRGRRDRDRF